MGKKSPISGRYSTKPIHFDGLLAVSFGLNDQTSLTPPRRMVASLVLAYHMHARVYWGKGMRCAIVYLCQSIVFSGKSNFPLMLGLNPCAADLELVSCHKGPVPQLVPKNKLIWGSSYTLDGRVFCTGVENSVLCVRLPEGPVLSPIILFADFTVSSARPFDCG